MTATAPSTRSTRVAYLMVIAAAVLFGLNAGVSRVPLRSGTPTDVFTTVRITAAFVVLALIALAVDRSALRPPRGRSLLLIAGLGLIGVTGVQWTYNIAINRLPLGIALLLEYLGPVLVVVWVRFVRREPVSARMWPGLALAVAGLGVVSQIWTGLDFDGIGVIMALGAAVCFATYFLLGEHNVGNGSPLHVIVWSFGIATLIMNAIQPVWNADSLSRSASLLGRFNASSIPAWLAMGWVVVLGTVVPFFLLLLALRVLSAGVVSVVAMLEPVVAATVGWAWFAESLTAVQLLGMAMVLLGVVLAQTARIKHPGLPPTGPVLPT